MRRVYSSSTGWLPTDCAPAPIGSAARSAKQAANRRAGIDERGWWRMSACPPLSMKSSGGPTHGDRARPVPLDTGASISGTREAPVVLTRLRAPYRPPSMPTVRRHASNCRRSSSSGFSASRSVFTDSANQGAFEVPASVMPMFSVA